MRSFFARRRARTIDPEGRRLLGASLESGAPILAPRGHGLLLSANGGGKTTRGAMPWLFSLAAGKAAGGVAILDSKDGEMAIQAVPMLARMGVKVAVIDDLERWPQLAPWRIKLSPFGAAAEAQARDRRDAIFAVETATFALVEEPKDDSKNIYFRAWPRNLIGFAKGVLLARDPETATPGGVAAILADPDMLKGFAEIEAEEGEEPLRSLARSIRDMIGHEHWPQHLEEAQRALRLFAPGTRLHEVGRDATHTHADLIREGYVVFLVGPQAQMSRLGPYYALHIQAFVHALYQGAGRLRVIADEFTNTPLKSLVDSLTTLRAFGGEIFLIAQSRSEIVRKFGQQETLTIEENAIVKQWFGFSSFEEAERVSKAMGEEHAVSSGLSGAADGAASQASMSLIRQRVLSPAELMAMPADRQLIHVKGAGFFLASTISQNQIAPFCHLIAPNPLEGGRLPADPKITLPKPQRGHA